MGKVCCLLPKSVVFKVGGTAFWRGLQEKASEKWREDIFFKIAIYPESYNTLTLERQIHKFPMVPELASCD